MLTENAAYGMIAEEENMSDELFYDDSPPSIEERRRHLEESGRRAGWDDPEMNVYVNYDENRTARSSSLASREYK